MKKPFIIGLLVFIAVLATGYGIFVSSITGPSVQGKKLSKWLDDLANRDAAVREATKQKLQASANEFWPPMVEMMKAKDSEQMQKWASVFNVEYPPSYAKRLAAGRGFVALGEKAAPAIPQLIPLLSNKDAGLDTAGALAAIGKDSVKPLIDTLSDNNAWTRSMAAASLSRMKAGVAEPAVDALLKMTNDKDSSARSWATTALGNIKARPDDVIPVLIALLDEKDGSVVSAAANSLGNYGPAAKDALPKLKKLAKSRDQEISGAASGAMDSIDPKETK